MSLSDCIESTCAEAEKTISALGQIRVDGQSILNELGASASTLDCVINGPAGGYCNTGKTVHLTLAEALSRLNELSIGAVTAQVFTASAGQTIFTMASSVPNPAALEVELNGAMCANPRDWTIAGTTLTFTYPLVAGDEINTRRFTV
jgi:hypothetical protein